MEEKNEYDKQAEDFLRETNTEFKFEFVGNSLYFPDDEKPRDVYLITLKRGQREYKFKFGNSINNSVKFEVFTREGIKNYNNLDKARKDFIKSDGEMLRAGQYKVNGNFKEPSAYDVLSCLTKYEPADFKDFCASYGYDEDSRKAFKIYEAVKEEYDNLKMLFSDEEINKLQDIN